MGAIQILRPGAITIFDDHLEDETFLGFLQTEAKDSGVEVYCRLAPEQMLDPGITAMKLTRLATRYPWITGWIPVAEPNQWVGFSWTDILEYVLTMYRYVNNTRLRTGEHYTVYFPPLSQDAGDEKDPRVGWEVMRHAVEMFLDRGDGFSWYSYWHALDLNHLAEQDMPQWLYSALEDGSTRHRTLIVEAGRFFSEPLGVKGSLGDEITERFGSRARLLPSSSIAHAVTFWVLGSAIADFEHQAWIDEDGNRDEILDYIAQNGP